jgi:hypothetical protein
VVSLGVGLPLRQVQPEEESTSTAQAPSAMGVKTGDAGGTGLRGQPYSRAPRCTVTAVLPLPQPPKAPVNLDEALRASCEGVAGITPEVFVLPCRSASPGGRIEAGQYFRACSPSFAKAKRLELSSTRLTEAPGISGIG